MTSNNKQKETTKKTTNTKPKPKQSPIFAPLSRNTFHTLGLKSLLVLLTQFAKGSAQISAQRIKCHKTTFRDRCGFKLHMII